MPAGTTHLIREGMLSDKIIRKMELEKGPCYGIAVRNQYLHAVHPIGWIKKVNLTVDGVCIPEKDIYFVLRGQWFSVVCLGTISEIYWNLMEEAEICFMTERVMEPGKYEISCTLTTSLSDDTQILDRTGMWPVYSETLNGQLELEAES